MISLCVDFMFNNQTCNTLRFMFWDKEHRSSFSSFACPLLGLQFKKKEKNELHYNLKYKTHDRLLN